MNADLKAKWIAALRSGEYQQGSCALQSRDTAGRPAFCCLGVLCDVAQVPEMGDSPATYIFDDGEPDTGSLRGRLRTEFGANGNGVLGHLIEMNDKDQASFAQIADYIDQHVPVD